MNMKDYFRAILMTFALATVAIVVSACSNPRPDINYGEKAESGYCESYEMKEILPSDSNDERLKKLRENTYFQGVCS
ncbi:hypothetical protein MMG00_12900 [Ignatzschineria rhizosphaerae]|uniref:Lipoprotein n=1 Tax=Ignatzschineria rhizosphaerae TaxID=2923279 RepID=A0ABY3X1A3_9GAMM|nr:hypothetical protein [Ignatzschineria rhizosphaerae]UNM95504.1 hypothetical protein MMG00_09755 [Ignatzschineria rhizosphaerae]UNM96080.1 hypothetical protein MMG00_12900 [Ignatzschineria rhizosphaerae]